VWHFCSSKVPHLPSDCRTFATLLCDFFAPKVPHLQFRICNLELFRRQKRRKMASVFSRMTENSCKKSFPKTEATQSVDNRLLAIDATHAKSVLSKTIPQLFLLSYFFFRTFAPPTDNVCGLYDKAAHQHSSNPPKTMRRDATTAITRPKNQHSLL